VENQTIHITVDESFKKKYLTDDFFVTYASDIDLTHFDYSILTMPFLTNVFSIVLISGESYAVDEIDRELYESLLRIEKVFKTIYPRTALTGKLVPKKIVDHSLPFRNDEHKTALLFSGGIDSVSSSIGHQDKQQLFITAWGHWDTQLTKKSFWKIRSQKIRDFAEESNHACTTLKSNYTSMLNYLYLSSLSLEIPKWRLGMVEGLGWAGLTAPILLSKGYATLRIASSHSWDYPYPSAASPFIDNNLRFCGLRVLHDQFDLSRPAKVATIDSYYKKTGKTPPFIKVCSLTKDTDKNCQDCRKCLTTILCFKAHGIDPQPYGLYYSEKKAQKILDYFTARKLNQYTILMGKEIQEILTKRKGVGDQLEPFFEEFLKIDFTTKIAFDTNKQHKLDWPTMIALLPNDHRLLIPDEYLPIK